MFLSFFRVCGWFFIRVKNLVFSFSLLISFSGISRLLGERLISRFSCGSSGGLVRFRDVFYSFRGSYDRFGVFLGGREFRVFGKSYFLGSIRR